MRLKRTHAAVLAAMICCFSNSYSRPTLAKHSAAGKQDTARYVSSYAEDNEKCLKCHGQAKYEYTNETLGRQIKAQMCDERIVDRDLFYKSNHKSFSCTDCHSSMYESFPHPGELRMEQKLNCIDCHGGDENYAHFFFDEINVEYQQSAHYRLEEEGFSCWKCHDPHTYKTSIRNTEDLKATIAFSNAICLNCHANFSHFSLLSDKEEISFIERHDWLPNQAAHTRSVRCIECHTQVNDSILVSHLIKPKDQAVKGCNECHSQNSLLMSSLYKFRSQEARRNNGFFNAVILNESYVIGANRNEYLNILSLVMFFGIAGVIMIHIFFRIIKDRKNLKGGDNVSVS